MYMRKYPNSTATTIVPNQSVSVSKTHHNPNPSLKTKLRFHEASSDLRFEKAPPLTLPGGLVLPNLKPLASNEAKEASRGDHVTFNLGAYNRRELKELKKRLVSELEQVRTLRTRIENTDFHTRPVYPPPYQRPPHPPSSVANLVLSADLQVQHLNRNPRGRKKGSCSKRSNPFGKSGQKPNPKRPATDPCKDNVVTSMMRRCGQILTKLMKHKHGWVFNVPVDVVSLGLHDYHNIIKKPMDLGTIKSNLEKNLYNSPLDFASDVRLTFNNALTYNPKGHHVCFMAETLLAKFEQMFSPAFTKCQEMNHNLAPIFAETRLEKPEMKAAEKTGKSVEKTAKSSKVARVEEKKEMSFKEKHMLGQSLMELPQGKMAELLSILKKRGDDFLRDGDEIELDIETLDNQTVWELDRFVKNCKGNGCSGSAEIEKVWVLNSAFVNHLRILYLFNFCIFDDWSCLKFCSVHTEESGD